MPLRAVPGVRTPPAWPVGHCCVLGWIAWEQETWAPRMPHTEGEAAELPAATAGHCHRTQNRCPSVHASIHPCIHPSLPVLLSPVICFPFPSLCPKSITSVPLPPAPTAASPARCDSPAPRLTCPIPRCPAAGGDPGLPGSCCPSAAPTPTAGRGGRPPPLPPLDREKRGRDSRTWGRREKPRATWGQGTPAQRAQILQPHVHWGGEAGADVCVERLGIAGLVPLPAWLFQHPQGVAQKACREVYRVCQDRRAS